jgi:phosphatidylglycerol---prolipoprotein diacylglyceryl transferase
MIPPDAIVHYPFVFRLGPLELTGFGLAVFAGFVIAQIIMERELRRRGHEEYAVGSADLVLAGVLGALAGSKIYYVLVITGDWSDLFSRGGFVFWGGFIGAFLLCSIVVIRKKQRWVRYADVSGPAIAAGYAVGRTGCWAVGDDYGVPWDGPLAVAFPQGAPPSTAAIMESEYGISVAGVAPDTVLAVHPTQLYETAMGFAMFMILWRWRGHKHQEGWLFGMYCVVAGAERFLVEFFRAKDDRIFETFSLAQGISVLVAMAGVAILMWRRRPADPTPAAA